jgi:hypothetical protein
MEGKDMEVVYQAEGIVEKVYGDEGETSDYEIDGLYVMEILREYEQNICNTNPNKVKITIEVIK